MMSLRTLWAWLRMVITLVVLFAVVLVVWMNWDKKADVWLFHHFNDIPVLWLIVITAVVSLVTKWVIGGVYRAYKELKSSQTKDAMNDILKKEKSPENKP
jgi:heme/copper-type cytochrome/quinol oxidase subunit 2